ncbi:putative metallo-beta-lactamase superfamily hydrolase [Geomicrobium halophilum]|uniref:Putative metallo-beta-lactamase superfamily hydrolase n=1 Tax=Geomicrobium halophilum TaxID=549000 RepID=A0A841Q0U6_9BACL|nr:hypothetical protein [Geomicrobium halophilum]MBB6449198.1 putative metallo-beta-lactamase superfamily hydrolase [Geomicrobium halophilum]
MAFGISRSELESWKQRAQAGKIAIITHYWLDERFPRCDSVTKVACADQEKLVQWGKVYGLKPEWIHKRGSLSHFDLFGDIQKRVLEHEGLDTQRYKFLQNQ